MKARRNFGLDFGSSYEISGGKLRVKESFSNIKIDIPIENAVFKMEPPGFTGWLLDFGDISVRQDGIEQHRCTNIWPCSRFHNALERAKRPQGSKVGQSMPDGIIFGGTVLLVPALESVLHESLLAQHYSFEENTDWHVEYCSWINRGDIICSFLIQPGRLRNAAKVPLRSPVAGLMLQRFGTNRLGHPLCVVLMPADEHTPDSSDKVFKELCDFCYQHRAYIFRPRPSEHFRGCEIRS